MPFVVPGVARFAINQSLEGRAVVNVLDYFIDTTGSTMSRSDAVEAQAGSIFTEWASLMLPNLVDDLTLNSVSWVDLDSSTGTTGSVVSGGAFTAPVAGGETQSPLPANTAGLVTKQAPSARGRRNGRLYLAGLAENATDTANGNIILAAWLTAINADLAAFMANTNELDTLGTAFSSNLSVVHVTTRDSAGNPLVGTHSEVQSLVLGSLLATQRRRLRG